MAHRPNYVVIPKSPPITVYVAVVEQACMKLKQGEAEELRGYLKAVIMKIHIPTLHHKRRENGNNRVEKGYHQDDLDS